MQLGVFSETSFAEHESSAISNHVASLPARIAEFARSTPNQAAIVDDNGSLTFAELEHKANRLAADLREVGVQPETCIGLFFDRSTDFIVAALAVLKSGAAYLPMDSATPADRAATMLADAAAPVVLSHRGKTKDWAADAWRVIEIDNLAAVPTATDPHPFDPNALAYVVYTSGSTGTPKGVEITHANLSNLVEWHNAAFGVTAASRASHVAGLGFDATAWEVWPHLAAGATVYIADEATRRSPQALRDWLVQNKITIAFVPTVLAEQLMHSEWPAETALRTLLTGADVLHRRPIEGLPFQVVNNYGPSECTVVATSGVITADEFAVGPPSIGRPIAGAEVLLLDEMLQPVLIGEPGELCIAGALVGRGYRNRPALTDEKFVRYVPASGAPVRVYRTGDRARWMLNGELQFLGRLDDQLKIRGYRIEPGEIVANLEKFSGVEGAAVAAMPSDAGPVLVAYVVTTDSAKITDVDLREFLARRLPDYMIPGQFVRLAVLPLTPNGKLNKAALPAPTDENRLPSPAAVAVAPTGDDLQGRIAALVASLLEKPSVAPTDNFFLLGGHSMLAAQLVARIDDLFGVKLTLRQLFSSPTVVALATEVARRQEAKRV